MNDGIVTIMELNWPYPLSKKGEALVKKWLKYYHNATLDNWEDDWCKECDRNWKKETEQECKRLGIPYLSTSQQIKALETWLKKHPDDPDEIPWKDHQWFLWLMNQDDLKKFLIIFNNQQKLSYNLTIKTLGEKRIMNNNYFKKANPFALTDRAKKWMGIDASFDNQNADYIIKGLDLKDYAYFALGGQAREFTQLTKSGKTIKKLVWSFDNLQRPFYSPSWMAMPGRNENKIPYWIVAIKKDEYNKAVISDLVSISGDIVQVINDANKNKFTINK